MIVFITLTILISTSFISAEMNMTGCAYSDARPLIFDAAKQPRGEIKSPGYDQGGYPANAYCDYTIKAPPGQVIKLIFKGMEFEPGTRCTYDKVLLMDGPDEDSPDLGSFCGTEPPDHPIVSTGNALHLSLRTNERVEARGFHALYEAVRSEDVCDRGYLRCTNNNCYSRSQKCDGKDDCLDGSDEENCSYSLPTTECGSRVSPIESDESPDRIVGGIEAKRGSWPWQADLQIKKFYPENHQCGGTLINAQWVMTAHHCLLGNADANRWKIILGNHDRFRKDPFEQIRYVTTIVIYPGFSGNEILQKPLDMSHDIALMKLNAPVTFSEQVRPACLPPQNYDLPVDTKCIATGWGETRGSGYRDVLKQAELYTQLAHRCVPMVPQTMICVKSKGRLQDACHGDSGGPLSCKIEDKWHVMGITSFGSETNMMTSLCAVSNMGTVFNKVSAKISWINDMIKRYS